MISSEVLEFFEMFLEMDCVAFRGERGLVNHFRHGWVGVDGRVDFIDREFLIEGETHFRDEFSGVVADDMCAEEFAVFFAVEEFGETFGFRSSNSLTNGGEWDFSNHVFDAFCFQSAFGFPD